MSVLHWQRRDKILLGTTAAIVFGGISGVAAIRSYQEVSFVNGLDVPVTMDVDGSRFTVEKDGRVERKFRQGVHEVRVLSAAGQVIDEGPIDFPGGCDVVVYNVLGAAPVYKADVVYSSTHSSDKDGAAVSFFGGSRLSSARTAQYVFKEPPQTITVDHASGSVTHVTVNVAQGGWIATLNYFESQSNLMKAAEIARAVARAEPGDEKAFGYARHFTDLAEGIAGTLRFLRVEKARTPDSIDANLAYIATMRRADRTAEARSEVEPQVRAHPDSTLAGLMWARVASKEEAQQVYEALLKSHPDEPRLRSSAAGFAAGELQFQRTVDLLTKMQDDPSYRYMIDEHATALVGLGRTQEALALVSRYASQEATKDLTLAILYARIARLPGAGSPPAPALSYVNDLAAKPSSEAVKPWAAALLGDPVSLSDLQKVKDDNLRLTIEIHAAAARDPREAQDKCASASPMALGQMNSVAAVLVAAELARAGDSALAEKILGSREDIAIAPSALLAYVLSGAVHPDLWRLDPELRAALDFVRARRLDEQGQPSAALLDAATRGDVLQGFVWTARKAWPKVGGAAVLDKSNKDKGAVVSAKAPEKGLSLGGAARAKESAPRVVLKKEKLL